MQQPKKMSIARYAVNASLTTTSDRTYANTQLILLKRKTAIKITRQLITKSYWKESRKKEKKQNYELLFTLLFIGFIYFCRLCSLFQ